MALALRKKCAKTIDSNGSSRGRLDPASMGRPVNVCADTLTNAQGRTDFVHQTNGFLTP